MLAAEELVPSMTAVLDRLVKPLPTRRAVICIAEQWRSVLPSVQQGFSRSSSRSLKAREPVSTSANWPTAAEDISRSATFLELTEPLPVFPGGRFDKFKRALSEENIRHLTAVSLQTREHNFGVILFPHAEG